MTDAESPPGFVWKLLGALFKRAKAHRTRQRLRRGEDPPEIRAALETIVQDGVAEAASYLFEDAREQEHFARLLLERPREQWPLVNGSYPADLLDDVREWVAWTLAPPDELGRVPPVGAEDERVVHLCAAIRRHFEHWAVRGGTVGNLFGMWAGDHLAIQSRDSTAAGVSGGTHASLFDIDKFPRRLTDLTGESLFDVLQYKHRVVPFVDNGVHGELVAKALAWLRWGEEEAELSVGVVTGPAGTGKSRLASQICDRLLTKAPHWEAGFADYEALTSASVQERATLLVCDYPEHHGAAVGDFLSGIWRRYKDGGLRAPVRVLLVSRHQESWSETVRAHCRNLDRLVHHHIRLEPGQLSGAELARHAEEAFAAFCDGFRIPEDRRPTFELGAAEFDRPLLIHIAALLAAYDYAVAPRPADGTTYVAGNAGVKELLDDLIEAEVRRLRQRRVDGADDGALVFSSRAEARQALCVATLTAPLRRDLPALLACAEAYGSDGKGDRVNAAEALLHAFPGSGPGGDDSLRTIAPVEPDLVAAHLIASTPGHGELIRRLAAHPAALDRPEYLRRMLQVLVLSADGYDAILASLRALLRTGLGELVDAAARAGDRRQASLLADTLSGTLSGLADPAIDEAAAACLLEREPIDGHPHLSRLAVTIAARATAHWETLGDRESLAAVYGVLNRLDPDAMAEYANRAGLRTAPQAVSGVWVMHEQWADVEPTDRSGLRQIGMAHLGFDPAPSADDAWGLRWAALTLRLPSLAIGRHADSVRSIAVVKLADDSQKVIAADEAGNVGQWDPVPSVRVNDPAMLPHGLTVRAMAVLDDQAGPSRVLIGCADGSIRLWDPNTRTLMPSAWAWHGRAVRAMASWTDAEQVCRIVSCDDDGTIRLLDSQGDVLWSTDADRLSGVQALVFVRSGHDGACQVVSGGDDGTLRWWDSATGEFVRALRIDGPGAVLAMTTVDYNGAGHIVTGGSDGTLRLWNTADGTSAGPPWHGEGAHAIGALTTVRGADGAQYVVIGRGDGKLQLWNPASHTVISSLSSGHDGAVRALSVISRGDGDQSVISAGADAIVRAWSLPAAPSRSGAVVGRTLSIAVVQRPGRPPMVASGGADGRLRFWDADSGAALACGEFAHRDGVGAIAPVHLPDGRTLVVSAGHDNAVQVWELDGASAPVAGPERLVACRRLQPVPAGGRTLVVAAAGRSLHVFDPVDTTWVPMGEEHPLTVRCLASVAMPGRSPLLVSGCEDYALRAWDMQSRERRGEPWRGHRSPVRGLAVIRGHRPIVVSGAEDGEVRFWNPVSRTECAEPWTADGAVIGLAAHTMADGRQVVLRIGDDKILRAFDLTTRRHWHAAQLPYAVHDLTTTANAVALATEEGVLMLEISLPGA